MKLLRDRRIAFTAAAAAVASWSWIVASGGIVKHPPRKPDRAVRADVAITPAGDPSPAVAGQAPVAGEADPSARLANLEARLDALGTSSLALSPGALAGDLAAWHDARERAQLEAVAVREFGATGDSQLDAWLLDHPLDGTRVRGTQRIAAFGKHVVREGDTLADGAARALRIEPAGVVVACRGREFHLAVRPAASHEPGAVQR